MNELRKRWFLLLPMPTIICSKITDVVRATFFPLTLFSISIYEKSLINYSSHETWATLKKAFV